MHGKWQVKKNKSMVVRWSSRYLPTLNQQLYVLEPSRYIKFDTFTFVSTHLLYIGTAMEEICHLFNQPGFRYIPCDRLPSPSIFSVQTAAYPVKLAVSRSMDNVLRSR